MTGDKCTFYLCQRPENIAHSSLKYFDRNKSHNKHLHIEHLSYFEEYNIKIGMMWVLCGMPFKQNPQAQCALYYPISSNLESKVERSNIIAMHYHLSQQL